MSSREKILAAIRANKPAPSVSPGRFHPVRTVAPRELYAERLGMAGGGAEFLDDESVNEAVRRLFPSATTVLSFVDAVMSTVPIPSDDSGYTALDLAVIPGCFAVAENGAVWVPMTDSDLRRASLLARDVAVIVPVGELVATMHDAVLHPRFSAREAGRGVFLSGPSKTADIEQCLVIGAHGPCALRVIFV